MANASNAARPNPFVRFFRYLGDVRTEIRRVVWPGRQEVLNSSVVVIATLVFFIAFTFVVDSIVIQLINLVGSIGG